MNLYLVGALQGACLGVMVQAIGLPLDSIDTWAFAISLYAFVYVGRKNV